MRHGKIAGALTALLTITGLALTGCGADNSGGGSSPTPSKATAPTHSQPSKPKQSPQNSERRDLLSFKIDDRSQAGFADVWVVWTIKNSSSKKSDYSWDWEAVDSTGKRVANSTEYVTNVQPGQTATGEDITTLKTAKVKINITNFNRTEAY
ncbi:hypothetical protein [Streptomyces sp. NPDC049915]|uniref:hypothetical protein n=1 Tax=Streptomyces sp. NPDC049915 TaxID=3155510 RepID=UPI003421EED8